jgi:hypothetical protein
MKKTYIQPTSNVISIADDLCLTKASVRHGDTGNNVDNIDVIEQDKSEKEYDWGSGSWGGE